MLKGRNFFTPRREEEVGILDTRRERTGIIGKPQSSDQGKKASLLPGRECDWFKGSTKGGKEKKKYGFFPPWGQRKEKRGGGKITLSTVEKHSFYGKGRRKNKSEQESHISWKQEGFLRLGGRKGDVLKGFRGKT